jgi:hypothetical protein
LEVGDTAGLETCATAPRQVPKSAFSGFPSGRSSPSLPNVRALKLFLPLLITAWASFSAQAGSPKMIKILPQFLDHQGQHAISPSLFDRDAYQARLRRQPEQRSGLRFAVQWKGPRSTLFKIRIELRGAHEQTPTEAVLEETVERRSLFSAWSELKLVGEDYKKFGELVAWRATLWDGGRQVGEQRSFLW